MTWADIDPWTARARFRASADAGGAAGAAKGKAAAPRGGDRGRTLVASSLVVEFDCNAVVNATKALATPGAAAGAQPAPAAGAPASPAGSKRGEVPSASSDRLLAAIEFLSTHAIAESPWS